MKKSHIKMLIFQFVIFLILILNSFVSNILRDYNFVICLLLALVSFKFIFGFERDRNRYTKDVIFEIIIFLMIFFILFYLFGIVIDFARTGNYLNWYGLKEFIIPIILFVILKEILRYMMLKKCEGNIWLLITTFILFIFIDVSDAIFYNDFSTGYKSFMFVALTLLPAIGNGILATYMSRNVGFKPIIFYLLVMELYMYIIPIIPDPNEYLTALIHFLLPIILVFRIRRFFERDKDEEIDRNYKKKSVSALVLPIITTIVLVYFTSGYFKYIAVAIASGSMENTISKGDVVIVEKIEDNYDKLKIKDVIAFQYHGVVIVHRIIDIVEQGGDYYFYTKGDANVKPDNYAITEDMLVGVIRAVIPYVGLPTIWLNEK